MKNSVFLGIFLIIYTVQANSQEKLKGGVIPVMSWGGVAQTEISVANYKKLKDVGVNIDIAFFSSTDAIAAALDAAGKAGVKLMISCPELKSDPEKIAKRFKDHPSLEGYYLADEPGKPQFQELADWAKRLKSADGKHYSFVNLYPNINSNQSKFGTKDYKEYVDTFDKMFPAPYISFDFYPVVDGAVHPRWYENMEFFANKYKTEGRPFWAFALTTSYLAYSNDAGQPTLNDFYQLYKSYNPEKTFVHDIPSLGELRLQVNVNLAYGAQGIEYWSFKGFGSPIDANGKRTIVYDKLQKLNTEIQNLSAVFLGAKMISVAHTGLDIPNETKRLSQLPAPIKLLETKGLGAVVSVLENGKNTFLVIVNRDFKNPMKLIIYTDDSVKKVLKDGTLIPANEYASATEVEPGDMSVYMFPTSK
ncbi:MAG TPA: hypothetical protein DIT07_05690 [Sphingobacteriaceae bacterium]|nr:hypothetical protein [Sphingobacteriaceae bacterium]